MLYKLFLRLKLMDIYKDIEIIELLDIYGKLLTERQLEILKMYYNYDISLSEIAENFSITRQGVRDCLIKCRKLLTDYEDKLNLQKKNKIINSYLDKIINETDLNIIKQTTEKLKNEI